jgi:hypothetical protein
MPLSRKIWKAAAGSALVVLMLIICWICFFAQPPTQFKTLDPRLRVESFYTGIANGHMASIDGPTYSLVQDLLHFVHLRKTPSDKIIALSPTTLTLGMVVNFTWSEQMTNFTAELVDPAGRNVPLTVGAKEIANQTANIRAVIIWVADPAPTNAGNYEFRMRLGSNNPPVFTQTDSNANCLIPIFIREISEISG